MKNNYIKIALSASVLFAAFSTEKSFSQIAPPNSACETVLDFDGSNDYVDVADGVYFNGGAFTVEGWVYPRSFANWSRIMDFGNGAGVNNVLLAVTDGTSGYPVFSTGTNLVSNIRLNLNQWNHVAGVWSGGVSKIYVNGVLAGTIAASAPANVTRYNNYIGRSNWADAYFNGRLDEVRIWNVARTQVEIQAAMSTQVGAGTAGLVANWKMNEASGTSVSSSSSVNYSGTFTNMLGDANWKLANGGDNCNIVQNSPPNAACGTALLLDGSNESISLPNTVTTNVRNGSALTVEYWFKGSSLQSAVRIQDGSGWIVAGWYGQHILYNDGGTNGISVGAAATDGKWHHVAMTWQQNTINGFKSYLDGILVAQRNSTNSPIPNLTSGAYIGSYLGGSEFTNGTLDEVRIWNVARTENELQSNMNAQLSGTETGLVGYWSFDEGVGSYAYDKTSNNYTGALTNMEPTLDWKLKNGGDPCNLTPTNTACESVLAFDGVNEFITTNAPVNAASGTWEVWVQKDSWTSHNDDRLFGNGINFPTNNSIYFSLHPSVGLHFRYGGTSQGNNITASSTVTQQLFSGTWHHLAATWNNTAGTTTIKIYLDGTLLSTSTTPLVIANYPLTFIGGDPNNVKFGPGKMDEVRIWNVARTGNEIKTWLNEKLVGNESGLVAYYRMNEGVNSKYALDKTVNAYTGILRNMEPNLDWKTVNGSISGNKLASTTVVIPSGTSLRIGGLERTVSGTYYQTTQTSAGCDSIQEIMLKIINTYTLVASPSEICATSGTATLTIGGSESGANYYVRNDADNSVFNGPIAGTGLALAIGTGTITTATKVYHVNETKPSIGLDFDGLNDYVARGSVLTTSTTNVTLEAWFKWAGTTGANQFVLLNGNSSASGYGIYLDASGGVNAILPGQTSVSANYTAVVGQWTHVALTRGASTWNFYVNGVSKASFANSPSTPSGNFVVGANQLFTEPFFGVIDEVRVWNVNKSASEILNNMYSCYVGEETGLIANYKFEDGTGSGDAKDGSQYGSYLTLYNMDSETDWVAGSDACSASMYLIPKTASVVVSPSNPTVVVNLPSATLCLGKSATLSASGATSYVWQPGNLVTYSVVVTPNSSQTYTVTGTNICGNDVKTSVITINTLPTLAITANVNQCSGNGFTVNGGVSYLWSNGSAAQTITATFGGVWSVTVTGGNGCSASASTTVFETPSAAIEGDIVLCGSSQGSLKAYGGGTYAWSNGAVTQEITNISEGTYSVVVTSADGCVNRNSKTVSEYNLPDILFTLPAALSDTICENSSSLELTGGLPIGGTYSGTGVTGGKFYSPSLAGVGLHTITYMVTSDNNTCTNTATATVNVKFCEVTTGIKGLADANKLSVYPNPAKESITVSFNLVHASSVTVRLLNVHGSLVYSQVNNNKQGVQQLTVDLSTQPKGIYWLQLMSNEGIATKKVVVE